MKININEVNKNIYNFFTTKRINYFIVAGLIFLAIISLVLHMLLNNCLVDITSIFGNFFTEMLGVILTVVVIKWLIDLPKTKFKNEAKFDIDSLVFTSNSIILDLKGLEEEVITVTELNLKDQTKDSFYQYIENSKQVLKNVDRQKLEINLLDTDSQSFEKLLVEAKELSTKLEDFKYNFDSLFTSEQKEYFIKCRKAIKQLINYLSEFKNLKSDSPYKGHYYLRIAGTILYYLDNIYKLQESF